jgi:hypothetical protein
MELKDVKFGSDTVYLFTDWMGVSKKIVSILNCDADDGASLIAEPRDESGDIFGTPLFRCEACQLQPVTRDIWEQFYPSSNPDNLSFENGAGRQT